MCANASPAGQDISKLEGDERQEAERLDVLRKEFIAKVRRAVADGKIVAILDNGDPLIYGPRAWCLEEFRDLKPVVVPGVSSFNAGNAALRRGITNTDRTKAVILSSTDWPGKTDTIEALSAHGSTMVLFTMHAEFGDFVSKLSTHHPPETPIAVVKFAGFEGKEEVIQGTLGKIANEIDAAALPFEYLIYVGEFLTYEHRAGN